MGNPEKRGGRNPKTAVMGTNRAGRGTMMAGDVFLRHKDKGKKSNVTKEQTWT